MMPGCPRESLSFLIACDVRQKGSLLQRVETVTAGGWDYVLGRVEGLGWTRPDMRPVPKSLPPPFDPYPHGGPGPSRLPIPPGSLTHLATTHPLFPSTINGQKDYRLETFDHLIMF
jgi:hypothetical protein